MAKKTRTDTQELLPMLMPASMMARISGIGEATLRTLMAQGELEYLQIGNQQTPSGPIMRPTRPLPSLPSKRTSMRCISVTALN